MDAPAAEVIPTQLVIHRDHYAIPKEELTQAEEQFLNSVRDPERFGADSELGKQKVTKHFSFYKDFTTVSFSFEPENRRGHPYVYTILYKKLADSWVPMSKAGGFR